MSDNDIGYMTKKRISQGAYRQLRSTIENMDDQTERYTNLNRLLLHKAGNGGVRSKAMQVNDCIRLVPSYGKGKNTKSFMNIRNDEFLRSNIVTNPEGFDDEGIIVTLVSKKFIKYVMYTKHSMLRAFQRDPVFLKYSIQDQIYALFATSNTIMFRDYDIGYKTHVFDVELSTLTAKVSRTLTKNSKNPHILVKTFIQTKSQERTTND